MNKPKKILFIGHLPPPYGGVAAIMKNLLESPLKNEFDLFGLDISRKEEREKLNMSIITKIFNLDYLYNFKWYYKLFKVLLARQIDIVHVQSINSSSPRDFVFCFISKLFRKKVVFHFHGGAHLKFCIIGWKCAKYLVSPCSRFMDTIIFISKGLSLPFEPFVNRKKILILPHFVNFIGPNTSRKPNDIPIVLFLGRLTKEKGIWDLLDAIEKVGMTNSRAKFVLAGLAESEEQERRLKETCKAKDIDNSIDFVGLIYGEDKKRMLENSDIFVLPSHTELFPVSLVEAMTFGLAIIATKVGVIPEIVSQMENGVLIDVGDSDSLAQSLLLLIKNLDLRKRMFHNNVNKSKQLYSAQAATAKLSALYNQL